MATSTATVTVASLLALTTPFSQSCWGPDLYDVPLTTPFIENNFTTFTKVVVPDTSASKFTSCQPKGWASVVSESRFSFSPALCPTRWAMWNMATTKGSSEPTTTAWCCEPSFSLYTGESEFPYPGIPTPCLGRYEDGLSTSLYIHAPWHVSWQASDMATLTPAPTILAAGETLASWTPPMDENLAHLNLDKTESHQSAAGFFVLVTVTPVLGLLALLGLGYLFFRARQRMHS